MFPRLVATVVALLLISPSASAQTVPALAAGVPPQQLPQPVAPHPINVPAPPDPVTLQKLELLRERIVQRDQIQREIDQLIVETQTPQVMRIYLELLEINVTAADAFREKNLPHQPVVFDPKKTMWEEIELDKLREAGIATSLARPQLMVLSGQQASSRVGNGENSSVTEVQLRADSLGNNRVFVDLCIERTVPVPGKKGGTTAEPPRRFSMSNPSLELTFDQPSLLSGLRSKETRTRRTALGRVSEEVTTETVLLITAEGVMPRQAGVVPASAIAPR
jgi:hypothetical protein